MNKMLESLRPDPSSKGGTVDVITPQRNVNVVGESNDFRQVIFCFNSMHQK